MKQHIIDCTLPNALKQLPTLLAIQIITKHTQSEIWQSENLPDILIVTCSERKISRIEQEYKRMMKGIVSMIIKPRKGKRIRLKSKQLKKAC